MEDKEKIEKYISRFYDGWQYKYKLEFVKIDKVEERTSSYTVFLTSGFNYWNPLFWLLVPVAAAGILTVHIMEFVEDFKDFIVGLNKEKRTMYIRKEDLARFDDLN